MLLSIDKIVKYLTIGSLAFVISGCNDYRYTHQSYHSSSYNTKYNNGVKSTPKKTTNTTKKLSKHGYHKKAGSGNQISGKIKNSKAMQRATMRPYEVFGKKYYPTLAHIDDKFTGVASWYGPDFHAKKTSNGEIYNMYAMTAAHKTLPMNTVVKVDNLENGLSTIVRINDRGPFVKQRIIDLSNAAAHKIKMVKKGTAKVRITVLGFNGKIAQTYEERQQTASVGNYYVQVGVFSKLSGAQSTKRKFEMILENDYKVKLVNDKLDDREVKRVWISGFRSEQEAHDFKVSNSLNGAVVIAQ